MATEQQMAIGAVDELGAFAEAAHDGVALRHGLPCGGADVIGAENHLGDFLVCGPGSAAIDDPKHLAEIASAVRAHAHVGRWSSSVKRRREPPDRIHAILDKMIEEDRCRYRSCWLMVAEAQGREALIGDFDVEIVPFGRKVRVRVWQGENRAIGCKVPRG